MCFKIFFFSTPPFFYFRLEGGGGGGLIYVSRLEYVCTPPPPLCLWPRFLPILRSIRFLVFDNLKSGFCVDFLLFVLGLVPPIFLDLTLSLWVVPCLPHIHFYFSPLYCQYYMIWFIYE